MWRCPGCDALVLDSRSECFKCGTSKPDGGYSGGGGGHGGGGRGGGGDPAAAMDKDVAVAASEETVRQGAVTTGEVRVIVTTVYPVRWGQYTQEG